MHSFAYSWSEVDEERHEHEKDLGGKEGREDKVSILFYTQSSFLFNIWVYPLFLILVFVFKPNTGTFFSISFSEQELVHKIQGEITGIVIQANVFDDSKKETKREIKSTQRFQQEVSFNPYCAIISHTHHSWDWNQVLFPVTLIFYFKRK